MKESIKDANIDKKSTETKDKETTRSVTDEDFSKKVDDAVDYSDENEMVDDQTVEEDDAKFREALSELVFKMPTAPISKPSTITIPTQQPLQKKKLEEDDDYDSSDSDKSLTDLKKQQQNDTTISKQENNIKSIDKTDSNETSNDLNDKNTSSNKKRLDTPLAEMLPSKYEDCDVTEIFPEFRPNKTLRFSRLFGPGKSSLLPNLWKNVRSKKRKKRRQTSESLNNKDLDNVIKENKDQSSNDTTQSSLSTNQKDKSPTSTEFQLKFAETYSENDLEEDQEELLKRPLECKNYLNSEEDLNGDLAQKVAHWRNGKQIVYFKI